MACGGGCGFGPRRCVKRDAASFRRMSVEDALPVRGYRISASSPADKLPKPNTTPTQLACYSESRTALLLKILRNASVRPDESAPLLSTTTRRYQTRAALLVLQVPFREKLFPDTHFLWSPQSGNSRKWKRGPVATWRAARESKKTEDFMKMINLSKLFITAALLCTPIIASNAQTQNAKKSSISPGNSVILCMPGLVFRCNQFGCFCVKP
jgi:hypothetical protein